MLWFRVSIAVVCLVFTLPAVQVEAQQSPLASTSPASCPAQPRPVGLAGKVKIKGVIGKDGKLHNLKAISGPDQLRQAALAIVSCRVYQPHVHDGEVVEVKLTVNVIFTKDDITKNLVNQKATLAELGKQQNAVDTKPTTSGAVTPGVPQQ